MPGFDELAWIRSGMEVRSSDGVVLGAVAEVWRGVDPKGDAEECNEGVCSRVEVHPTVPGRIAGLVARLAGRAASAEGPVLFVPCGAVADARSGRVILAAAAEEARAWTRKPKWIPGAARRTTSPPEVGPGSRSDPGMAGSSKEERERHVNDWRGWS